MNVYTGSTAAGGRVVDVTMTPDEAGLLATALGAVIDGTESEAMDNLYNLLREAGISETGVVDVSENSEYDAEDPDDVRYFVRLRD